MELKQNLNTLQKEINHNIDNIDITVGRRMMKTSIYWDYQNVQLKSSTSSTLLVDKIIGYAREKGVIGTLRAYANWSSPYIKAETAQNLNSAGFELIHVPQTKKNAVDLVISTDLGRAALTEMMETVILITSDGDFIHALANLRRAGKRTVVIANPDVANERLQLATDEFLPLNRFQSYPETITESSTLKTDKSEPTEKDEALFSAFNLLTKAVNECSTEGRSLHFSSVATKMYELEPGFDYKKIPSLPYKRFQPLVFAAAKENIVKIRDTEGWQEIYIPNSEEEINQIEEQLSSSGRQLALDEINAIKNTLTELDSEITYFFLHLISLIKRKIRELDSSTISNSETKQLLISLIDAEIFLKQDDGKYLLSPMWRDLWVRFSVEYRL